jgi:hypothetical protein
MFGGGDSSLKEEVVFRNLGKKSALLYEHGPGGALLVAKEVDSRMASLLMSSSDTGSTVAVGTAEVSDNIHR